jgi:predicted metal-dependent phosphoesterase TrpH
MKIDTHIHTNYSKDGMSGIKDIVLVARKKGMDAIAITDHNSIEGWEEAKQSLENLIFP